MDFDAGDLVRVPFPHIERLIMVARPAVVLTLVPVGPHGLLIWTLMITNAERPFWPGDVPIPNAVAHGLLIPSKVRTAKIAAVACSAAVRIGRLDDVTWAGVREQVRAHLLLT